MENRHSMNFWFEQYLRDMKNQPKDAMLAESWGAIWELCFRESIGASYPEDLDDGTVSDLWEEAELKLHNRTDLFSAFLLLRSLFSYIEFVSGIKLYDIVLPNFFVDVDRGLTEEGCKLLDEVMLSYSGRCAVCFWIVLHAPLTFTQVQHLTRGDFKLDYDTLTLRYYKTARSTKKSGKKPPVEQTAVIPIDDRAYEMLAKLVEEPMNDGDLLFRPEAEESRKKLTDALTLFSTFCGLPKLNLSDLERAPKLVCQNEDAVFSESSEYLRALVGKLDPMLNKLPRPLIEHARRARTFASFFTEHLRVQDWFIDLGYDEYDLLFAVYYHDLGKVSHKPEDHYPGSRAQSDQNRRYRAHVEDGETNLTTALGKMPENLAPDTPEGLLRDAIRDHHERLDGSGFPQKKIGEEITFVGRLCGLADELDHRFFIDDPESEPEKVLCKLEEDKDAFDPILLNVLFSNGEIFCRFVEEMRGMDRAKRGADAFGIRYVFRPYVVPKTKEIVAYDAHLLFNDRYYGIIDSNLILPLMEEHPSFCLFTKLQIRRLLRLLFTAYAQDKNTPMLFCNISVVPTEKGSFFAELLQSFIRYNTRFRKVVFTFDEYDLIANDTNVERLCEQFHLVGAAFGISGFGGKSTLLPQLHRIHPDYIILHSDYADMSVPEREDFIKTVFETAKKCGTQVCLSGVNSHEAYDKFSPMGFCAFGGQLSGKELSEKEYTND